MTPEQIAYIVNLAIEQLNINPYTGETPGIRVMRLFNDLIAETLENQEDQRFRVIVDYQTEKVTIQGSETVLKTITATYPEETWYPLYKSIEDKSL
jgi:uncharacterized protein YqiB (DUF1249 family)